MILRVLAALALVLGLAALLLFRWRLDEGPFASAAGRHLRALKQRVELPAQVSPVSLTWFRALPRGLPPSRTAPLESRAVVMEGWVQRLQWAADGDVHLEIADRPPPPGGVTRYVTGEVTPAFRRRHPGWRYEALAAALRPNVGTRTPWPGGPRRARVTGWLLYDFQNDNPPSEEAVEHRAARVSGWEIHPVTRMEVWDDARGAWVEVGP